MKITQIEPLAYHCHLIKVQLILAIVSVAQFVQLFVTLWIAAHQAPLSMEFSRHEYWSGLPFPSPIGYSWIIIKSQYGMESGLLGDAVVKNLMQET